MNRYIVQWNRNGVAWERGYWTLYHAEQMARALSLNGLCVTIKENNS